MTLKNQSQLRKEKKAKLILDKKRFNNRNWEAMGWCNSQGFTIYASAQAFNTDIVKLFKQKGEKFKPLSDKLYDQNKEEDIIAYVADIDTEYERMYNLKNKN